MMLCVIFSGVSNGEFFVISNPMQVFGSTTTQKKITKEKLPPVEKVVTNKKVGIICELYLALPA